MYPRSMRGPINVPQHEYGASDIPVQKKVLAHSTDPEIVTWSTPNPAVSTLMNVPCGEP